MDPDDAFGDSSFMFYKKAKDFIWKPFFFFSLKLRVNKWPLKLVA